MKKRKTKTRKSVRRRPLHHFLHETGILGTLSGRLLFTILYGDLNNLKDFTRYSRKARREVLRAAFQEFRNGIPEYPDDLLLELRFVIILEGLTSKDPAYVKKIVSELKLWKECGLPEDQLESEVYGVLILNVGELPITFEAFKAFMECGQVKLNTKDRREWGRVWLEVFSLEQPTRYKDFARVIEEHTF